MKRTLCAIALAIVAVAWPRLEAQRPASSPGTVVDLAQGRADGLALLQVAAARHGIAADDVHVTSAHLDSLSMAHIRAQQTYRGIPVVGGEAIAHLRSDGGVFGETDNFVEGVSVDTTPRLTVEAVTGIAAEDYGCSACLTGAAATDLWILRLDGIDHLVYRVQMSRLDGSPETALPVRFVDAHDGFVVLAYNDRQTATTVSLDTSSSQAAPAAGAVLDAQDGARKFLDYLQSFHGYKLRGITSTTFSPLITLDVIGHLMTQQVTRISAGLINQGESGAIGESWSDVMSAMLKRYVKADDPNIWSIAEDASTPAAPGDSFHFIDDPHHAPDGGITADDDPDHYSERYLGALDNGGVHHNSGIANKAFYLLANGGTHHLGGSMTGIGADEAARIWFLALTSYMTSSTTFEGARDATLNAATALYGEDSAQYKAVVSTWCLVGVGACAVPETVSVTPNTGSGFTQLFTAIYHDADGVGDLKARLKFSTPDMTGTCTIEYNAATNLVRLQDDAGVWLPPVPFGSGELENSQCALDLAQSSAIENGNELTLAAYFTFNGSFAGLKTISLMARSPNGETTPWVPSGTWTVGAVLDAISVTPNTGTGVTQVFTATYSDSLGASDMRARIRFTGAAATGPCLIEYNAATDLVRMQNDAGVWLPAVPLGSGPPLVNSQCTLDPALSSATESGNDLTLALHLHFTGSFTGLKTISLLARNAIGQTTGWVSRGTWTVGAALDAVSVTPNSGNGYTQLFTATYSDSLGAADLRARIRFAGTADPGPCQIDYNASTDLVRMQDNAGAWTAAVPFGSGTLANSQCTLNLALSSATENGNNLTLALHLTFTANFSGDKAVSLMARSASGQNTGWVPRGTWTVPGIVLNGVSVTPDNGSGLEQVFTAVYTDSAGASDLVARIRFNGGNQPGPCQIEYNASTDRVRMQDDAGAWTTAVPFGIGTLTNHQCLLDLTDSTAVESGTTVTLTLHLTFHLNFDGAKTVALMARSSSGQATAWLPRGSWTVPSGGSVLINGYQHTGAISTAGEVDSWTFTATAGDRITVHIGEITDTNGAFGPWIRLTSPSGASLGETWNASATVIDDVVAPATGTYRVRVASYNGTYTGTGTYRLTMTHTPGPITISPGDDGGPLINGAMQTGTMEHGDVDVWTFTATAGDRIAVNIGEITDANTAFAPWIRLWSPTGATLGDVWGASSTVIDDVVAPVTGTYLVLVATYNGTYDGTGTYRLTMTHTPGPITVSPGDDGGPLTNGAMHTGTMERGDLDVWTFTATAGDRIAINIGEITDTNTAFGPWLRLWSPTGATLGDVWGASSTVIDDAVAPVTGTYLVLVGSYNGTFDGTGTYRLTMTHTPGPITVSPGDDGGPLTNGAMHTGTMERGDLDVWTFTATAGDRIAVNIGEITDTNTAFGPWLRLWSPTGATLGDVWGASSTIIDDVVAPVTGTYLVLVGSYNGTYDGTGTYRLTMAHTPGPITVSPGDDGGPLTNGAMHTGTMELGDLDVWTFTATAGDRIAVNIGEITDTNTAFGPWIRLWSPTGATLGDVWGASSTIIDDVVAPVTGTYLVLVGSYNGTYDGTGTYRLTMAHTPGPITVSSGDEGGALTIGVASSGTMDRGDLDVWTFTATAGAHVTVSVGEVTDTNTAFGPWIRLWSPTGATLGDTWGATAAVINNVTAPVTGTYLVLVASYNGTYNGTGTYNLTVTGP